MEKIVIDAYAWIEFFIGSKKGLKVKEILEDSEEIYTPGTVLAEIARKYFRENLDNEAINERLQVIASTSNIANLDVEISLEAAKSYSEIVKNSRKSKLNTPSLFDAIVLGTCRVLKSKIVTGDEHFRDLAETIWIGESV